MNIAGTRILVLYALNTWLNNPEVIAIAPDNAVLYATGRPATNKYFIPMTRYCKSYSW